MKTVFLILYLWHASYGGYNQGGNGGPALTITPMPTLATCETVGAAAKALVDSAAPPPSDQTESFRSAPAVYRCVEVNTYIDVSCPANGCRPVTR